MGWGWTHSYNIFLFSQFGNMFRMDGVGRVTKYQYQSAGFFVSTAGYFETLTNNLNGTFTVKQKDGTSFLFASIPNTPFQVSGPVYRLTSITDRNNNVTTVSYDSHGNLIEITDTYGRSLTLSYNAQQHLTAITDPLGRTTSLSYDSTGRRLTQITDPLGKVTQYTYNTLSQITEKIDKDGRVFTYAYTQMEPTAVQDGAGNSLFSLSNPNNWATDPLQLAEYQLRVYLSSTTSKTDGRGNVWKLSYESHGYVTSAVAPDGATTGNTYDPTTLQVASQTDADGNTTTYQYDSMGNLIQRTDALGFVTSYTYEPVFNQMTSMTDANGRVTTYQIDPANGNRLMATDPLGNSEKWTYDSHGNVLTHTDKNGNTTTYAYDGNGNPATFTTSIGEVATTVYDREGNLISRTDANNHTTTYTYDDLDRLTKQTDPLGKTTQYFYDGQGNQIQVTDRDGNSTQYQYDLRSRLIKVTDALSQSTTTSYDGNNNVVSSTDKDGHTTTYAYDVQNRLLKTVDALGDTSTTAYDPFGNVISSTDANGHTTTYTYDALNRRATSTDAVGSVTTTIYDVTGPNTGPCAGVCTGPTKGSGLPSEVIDGDGHAGLHVGVTYYHYDGLDRRIQQVRKQFNSNDDEPPDPNDAVTYTTYDPVGNVLTVTEPDGNTTTDVYDADDRKIKDTNAAGDVTMWTYDGVSNVITMTAPTSNVTNNTYDADNRVINVTDGGGTVRRFTYDAEGHQLTRTDGNGNTTTTTYDAIYRITQVTDPLGQNTAYTYDPVGNLLTVTDRNGNVTSYAYDAINRRTSMTDALGNTTKYQYDAVGNRTKLTDANGDATTFAFDAVNRLITETDADGFSRSYTYDFVDNLTSRTDQNGVTTNYTYSDLYFLTSRSYPSSTDTFTYDLSGRMLSATRMVPASSFTWAVTFTYDGANRVLTDVQNGQTVSYSYHIPAPSTRTVNYPGGRTITESLDLRSRISEIDDASSPPPIVTYSYDPGNRVTQRGLRNGTSAAFTYNNDDWITNLQHSFGATPIAGFAYPVYDNEGNKKCEQKLQDLTHSEAYQYDTTYRLTNYAVGTLNVSPPACTVSGVPTTQTAYTLDPVGNWPKKVTNGTPENRTHNSVNEITTINGAPLSYDNNGNLTADSLYTYTYDEEKRLTAVTRNSDSRVVGQYQYDTLSRRVQKVANPASPPAPTTTLYFYDYKRIIEEQNGAAMTQATYVYGNYIDEVLTMNRLGTNYYYHQNALWSVEAVSNSAGSPVERYRYDAYGFVTVTDGAFNPIPQNAWGTPHSAIGNPYMFTGRQLDEETGLYFYRARYYDTAKGRFLQRDPLEYSAAVNQYEYVSDEPTFAVDPSGLDEQPPTFGREMIVPRRMSTIQCHGQQGWPDYRAFRLSLYGCRDEGDSNAPAPAMVGPCQAYAGYDDKIASENYNCAGLAHRTYTYIGRVADVKKLLEKGKKIECKEKCRPFQIKHWLWEFEIHVEDAGFKTDTWKDFHTVAGQTDKDGNDPEKVWSKDGKRPVKDDKKGPDWRPPAKEEATKNNEREDKAKDPLGRQLYWIVPNEKLVETCWCLDCPFKK
jgi:RHS repeat-associated protein